MGKRIVLNDEEIHLAKYIAKRRHTNNRKVGVANQRIGGQSDWETDFGGICGEIAVAKAYNLYPDMKTFLRKNSCDLVGHGGKRVEVKWTKYDTGHLLESVTKKRGLSDVYILVTGTPPELNIRGWVSASEFLHERNLRRLPGTNAGPKSFVLPQSRLNQIK